MIIYFKIMMKTLDQSKCLILFVKAPVPGAVKTRLAEDLGVYPSVRLYRAFAADILAAINRMNINLRIFYHPAKHLRLMREWLGENAPLFVQQGADLGERMHNALCCTAAEGFRSVVLIGSDIPDLNEQIINSAFSALAEHPAVIGPAMDGGYYLIGFRSRFIFSEAFTGIDWGSPAVLEKTLQRFREKGREVSALSALRDIDTRQDLQAFAADMSDEAVLSPVLQNTRAVLLQMGMI
ncbi:MAG: TIGR04282 family arsenosugar biosynthesis glycosyltransferase [Desulfobacteraceae bacterium]|nr:TIGR04282 family arsenosugar biosynthesis glycosyltransferase [Desulfobacteraceae bacterium]